MSLIERALEKQRREADDSARPGHRRPPRTREPGVGAAAPQRERWVTSGKTLPIDIDRLRAAGAVPPVALSDWATEEFRRIKWPLLETITAPDAGAGPVPNTVLVTSAIAGEGKSFVSFNLALSVSRERDLDVLLVDADVAKRHLTSLLGADACPGLTDAAADAQLDPLQLVLATDVPGLYFLPSGQRTSLASELFASRRMTDLVTALRQAASDSIVVFDSSPLLATTETQVLASLVDQIVLVVRAESTPQPLVLEAVRDLPAEKQIRCVLNQARVSHLNEYYYGYGYPNEQQPRLP